VNAAALLLPFVVALPPGASAPPPGALPAAARVTTLDRELGLALVRLPKRGVAPALKRLRSAPGVRYVERDAPLGLAAEGCDKLADSKEVDPGWRRAIHLSKRSAAGIVIGIADSGIDDDRLAPRQAPTLHLSAGGKPTPHDPVGHGTAVASMLVANRPELGVVGIVPDATLLSARIIKSTPCKQATLVDGLVSALGWLRMQRAQVVNISATAKRSNALVESLRALQLSGALVVAAVGNEGGFAPKATFPASQPGVIGVGELAFRSSTQVATESTRGSQVDLVAPAQGIKIIASGAEGVSFTEETAITPHGTSFATPLVTATAAMVWASHRDWTAAEVANALARSATPLAANAPSKVWGYGRLDVSRALRTRQLPDSHEPNDWGAAALDQRPLRPGSVVVASLGWARDKVDAYTVDVPAGTQAQAVLRHGGQGVAMKVLSVKASDDQLMAVARLPPRAAPLLLPAGRSLLVVARSQGEGAYTLALSGVSGAPGA
jgi:subtilisin family serine protease